MKFSIDNNILNSLTSDTTRAHEFCQKFNFNKPTEIYIPYNVLDESFSGGSLPHILNRFKNLGILIDKLKNRLCISTQVRLAMKKEVKNKGHLNKTPELTKQQMESILFFVRNPPALEQNWHQEKIYIEKSNARKIDFLENDRKTRQMCIDNKVPYNEIKEIYDSFMGIKNDKEHYKLLRTIFGSPDITGLSKRKFKKVMCHKNFKTMHALASMIYFRHICNCLYHYDPNLIEIKKMQLGNWTDLNIASCAAYNDYLVTEDSGLKEFCSVLKDRGVINFETIGFKDFEEKIS
ncbi:MAG: hypothetical protein IPM57_10400 [Oligoflexia bacterium]|nr:hypothetical protein [Oligoflexia bacterium]